MQQAATSPTAATPPAASTLRRAPASPILTVLTALRGVNFQPEPLLSMGDREAVSARPAIQVSLTFSCS